MLGNKSELTVLFITSRLPFPPTDGRKIVLYHYCRYMHEKLGCRLIVVALGSFGSSQSTAVPSFIDRLVVLPLPSLVYAFFNWIVNIIKCRIIPLQSAVFWSARNQRVIQKIIAEENVDVVIGDMIRTGEYLLNIGSIYRKVADLDDLISTRYFRQITSKISTNPVGKAGSTRTIQVVSKILHNIGLIKAVVWLEAITAKRYETVLATKCDCSVLVSPVEVGRLMDRCPPGTKVYSIPPAVDHRLLTADVDGPPLHAITFLGALNVPHNVDGITRFIDEIWPRIMERDPDVVLRIVGRSPSARLQNRARQHQRIDFIGEVDDFVPILKGSKVFVAPIWYGSGIKTKILEAMALGLPVVTTSIGVEGIAGVDGIHYVVADDDEGFANSVLALLADESRRVAIGRAARQLVEALYSFDTALASWGEILTGRREGV
ncbi:glycosyltransferase family 4 protein [Alicyclobacillus macrosporangiidus]|uniref:glycosyltransferase family 4 protein n=1 Tax=Alicyclobacillus macrosporangiidus TaxID=392015 RepID=UPI0009F8082C|nr:glycosyltransferase family 4 protein [Alicyclobacillus macrosporangiidus]